MEATPAVGAHVSPRRSLAQSAELLWLLVLKELRVRYKGSVLGYLWAIANPLAMTVVYYIAFRIILRVDMPYYGVYLVTGLFPWAWASASLSRGSGSYRANESLVRKVQTERLILPLSDVLQEMLHFLFACPVILIALVVTTGTFFPQWVVLIPVMAVVQLAVTFPLTLILASIGVIARDVEHLVGVLLQVVFFLTPIVYPLRSIPDEYRRYFELNPFFSLVNAWRSVFYEGALDLTAIGWLGIFVALFGAVAWTIHRRVEPRIGETL